METKKQEAIRLAWIPYGVLNNFDSNGWVDVENLYLNKETSGFYDFKSYSESDTGFRTTLCRPKSLKNIEKNNGWISINSEDDLPKENGNYWIIVKDQVTNCVWWYVKKDKCFYFGGVPVSEENITHYQPIQKPKPPIF